MQHLSGGLTNAADTLREAVQQLTSGRTEVRGNAAVLLGTEPMTCKHCGEKYKALNREGWK